MAKNLLPILQWPDGMKDCEAPERTLRLEVVGLDAFGCIKQNHKCLALKSCSGLDHRSQASKECSHQDMEVVPEVEARISCDNMGMLHNTSGNTPVFNPLYKAPGNWLNEASLHGDVNRYDGIKLGQNEENRKANGYGGKPGIKEHDAKSNSIKFHA
ncbi:hypothetical protein GH714_036695 [Hevea brasiliensis]|uniref:Uncharacterized protein n=1 Tax=Hevea brasiliensis TaxID=3981 RepID=A0A6A6KM14_HEVBR|nr:hypothetical protein GH714_036695 [Hevea brasiliensis]